MLFRSEAAKAVIADVPDAIVGIGTVLSVADFEQARKLGARFAVSPGATRELLDAAAGRDPCLWRCRAATGN